MKRWMITVTVLATVWVACGACNAAKTATDECNAAEIKCGVVKATLNGLEITIDAQTGSIVGLKHPDVGTILEASADNASIIDLAYPIKKYPPLRLASRHSKGVQITKSKDSVTIVWPKLGLSRKLDNVGGKVSVTVVLKAAPDGKSVIISCEIDNQSDNSLRQILFPDFMGLLPFAGEAETKFTCANFSTSPFQSLSNHAEMAANFYPGYPGWAEYQSGCFVIPTLYDFEVVTATRPMVLDWMEFGSLKSGFSIYPKRWGWDVRPNTMMNLSHQTKKLRLLSQYKTHVAPYSKWQSLEHWLTPHKYGWAEGIKSYSQWATPHFNRKYPVPQHIKEGLGFRTIFMSTATGWAGQLEDQPIIEDDKDIVYKFSDLPAVAKDAIDHGIDELNLWAWGSPWRSKRGFQLPLKITYPGIGTMEELSVAVKECKEMGVNVNIFLSISVLEEPMAQKFGVELDKSASWSYHPYFIPQMNPYYRFTDGSGLINASNKAWRKEVLTYIEALAKAGLSSITWDVYRGHPGEDSLYTLSDEIRAITTKYDMQSSFGGESVANIEFEVNHLDYTWNWRNYDDAKPYANVFSAPRMNSNINTSSRDVKMCFVDNLYMNVMPNVPGNANGSGTIADNPPLANALKQCSKLRKQFMDYFVSGKQIGDCVLTKPAKNGFQVSAYVLPDSIAMFVLHQWGNKTKTPLDCDLSNWLKSDSGKYEVKIYDGDGKLIRTEGIDSPVWKTESSELRGFEGFDIEIYEFTAKK